MKLPRALPEVVRRRSVLALLGAILAVGLVVGIVLAGDGDEPPPVQGTPKEAVDTIEDFKRALRARDFATICEELYTIEAREAAGGEDCQSILAQEAARLREPKIEIVSLSVFREGAVVSVRTSEGGRAGVRDTIRLVRQRGRYRISSAGPVAKG